MGNDGATNFLSRSVSNVIFHVTKPLFIEYLRGDLNRETSENEVSKLQAVSFRLDALARFSFTNSYISNSCIGMQNVRKKLF